MAHANFLKESKERDMGNYRLISALLCFSKMLEKMRQNRVYKRLNENDLGCIKQFGFQKAHSTDKLTALLPNLF